MTDLREFKTKDFDAVSPSMKQEPNAHKRACFRAGWDAAIAALPNMVPDLVWEESEYGFFSNETIAGFYSTWQDDGEYGWHLWDVNGDMLDEVTTGGSHYEAKDAANAHHRAQIMAALGVK